jgi:hypothetical protein
MIGVDGFGESAAMIEFKRSHFEREITLWGVRWYVAYPINYRQPQWGSTCKSGVNVP